MGIEDEYAAFCLDETCLFMIQQAREKREPDFGRPARLKKAEGQAEHDDQRRGGRDDSSADGLTHLTERVLRQLFSFPGFGDDRSETVISKDLF